MADIKSERVFEDEENLLDFSFKNATAVEVDSIGVSENDPLLEYSTRDIKWEYSDSDLLCGEGDGRNDEKNEVNRYKKFAKKYEAPNGHIWHAQKPKYFEKHTLSTPSHQARCKGPARSVSNGLESWLLLIDEPILIEIVKHTNAKIRQYKDGKNGNQRCIDLMELRAWIGLNYLCGIFRNSAHNGPLSELWTLELGNAIYRATMTLKRFEFISECLSLSESPEKLEQVMLIWDKFLINCRSYYAPSACCNIDEHILCFEDEKCGFQCCLPAEPDRKGLRIVSLVDAKTLYMSNALVSKENSHSHFEILQLTCDIKNTARIVVISERYTSLQLAKRLARCQLKLNGALRATAPEIPTNLQSIDIESRRTLYAESEYTLTISPQRFLLSYNISSEINPLKLYHHTSRSCGRFQDTAAKYSTGYAAASMIVPRWPLQFLHTILNYAAVNAWVLIRLSDYENPNISQRDFQRQLGLHLTQQHLQRRLQRNCSTPLMQRIQICEILGQPIEHLLIEASLFAKRSLGIGVMNETQSKLPVTITLVTKLNETFRRCRQCSRQKRNSKTRLRCQQCLVPYCNNHLVSRCFQCTGVERPEPSKADSVKQ